MSTMDFLDSIDSSMSLGEHTHRQARRVRSWYLYEQFKALKKNQMDATQKLRDRSYQKLLLHQELRERRARRRLVDEFSLNDSGIDRVSSDIQTCLSVEINDSFQSLDDILNETLASNKAGDTNATNFEEQQEYPNQTGDNVGETFKDPLYDNKTGDNVGEAFDDALYDSNKKADAEDINTRQKRTENTPTTRSTYGTEAFFDTTEDTNLADDIKEGLEYAKKIISENINLQLETVKDNLQCLEEFSKVHDDDVLGEVSGNEEEEEEENVIEDHEVDYEDATVMAFFNVDQKDANVTAVIDVDHRDASVTTISGEGQKDANVVTVLQGAVKKSSEYDTNLWSKLVSFAHQVVQLNHGNCYYDYSSQVLTTLLVCDVLRRGLHRMCHILQPYVSPVKFETDIEYESKRDIVTLERRRKKSALSTKSRGSFGKKESMKSCKSYSVWNEKSPITIQFCGDCHMNDRQNPTKIRRLSSSEPWRSLPRIPAKESSATKSSSSLWPEELRPSHSEDDAFTNRRKVANPMLKLAKYIDTLVKDVGVNL